MINAKTELLDLMESIGKKQTDIEFIAVVLESSAWGTEAKKTIIKELEQLNVLYDNGYGCQELLGYVLFTDGTWLERHAYDGSEWWEYKSIPTVAQLEDWLGYF